MTVSIRATVSLSKDDTTQVIAKIKGLTDKRMGEFAADVVTTAKSNAASLPFDESTGELASKIEYERLGDRNYEIRTYSGHASYIEMGTRFIDGKMPFLWPAYRTEKKKFFSGGKWI